MQLFKQFGLAAIAAIVAAPACAGVYDVNYRQFTGVYTLLDNGEFYGLHFVDGDVLAGHPRGKLAPDNSTANLGKIAWANFIDDRNEVGAQEPNGRFGRSFSAAGLEVAISGSMGNFKAAATPRKPVAPLSLAELSGSWSGQVRTAGIGEPRMRLDGVTIDPAGNLRATVGACELRAMMAPYGTEGIYTVQARTGGAACKLQPVLQGIMTPLARTGSAVRMAVQLDSPDQAHTAVFILDK